MSTDGPPGGGDRTVLLPTPGGRRPAGSTPAAPPVGPRAPAVSRPREPAAAPTPSVALLNTSGINPLISAAGSLLTLASQLRTTSTHGDPASLANHIAREISEFEVTAKSRGVPDHLIRPARYALCTLLDEFVLSTPWGAESGWAQETLLIRFHREAFGGEKFFGILQEALQQPAERIDLIEFLYLCMALGLEGQYKVRQDGYRQLQRVMDQTYEVIRRYRGEFERELAPHWRGVRDQRLRLASVLPLWAVAAISAGLLVLVYVGFLFGINERSDPVVSQIAALATEPLRVPAQPAAAPVRRASLATLLGGDIAQGMVEVQDLDDRSMVSLWGLFASGEARVPDEQQALLQRVAQAMAQFPGRVSVLGHTDNQPVRSLRFPDNWSLSERRAEAVQRLLITILAADLVTFQGLGDSKPLVENDNPANRAINRRVEIILYPESPEL